QVYDNLADVWLARSDFIRARTWTRLALRFNASDARARAAMTTIETGLKPFQWPASISGLYVRYGGAGQWQTVKVREPERSQAKITLFAFRLGLNWRQFGPASYGDINDENATLVTSRTLRWRYVSGVAGETDCSLTLTFSADNVTVAETPTCATVFFGHGVSAVGDWERICGGSNGDCGETPSGRYHPG